jgi:uncharacterized damage-inducible protein DinB
MIDALRLLTYYNIRVNVKLFGILQELPDAEITRDAGSYFGSILDLLNHVLTSDLGWLSRFRDAEVPAECLDSPVLVHTPPGFGKPLHHSLQAVWEHQQGVDQVFQDLSAALTEASAGSAFSYTDSTGTRHSFVLGDVLLHVLNHATHHRGQISQILDSRGVDHDFSNLLGVLREHRA